MFTLELDLIVTYTPPMSDRDGGIRLTRELQLPFAPYNGLELCGKNMNQGPAQPEGFTLNDVVWDIDRQVFMAHAKWSSDGLPMEDIPADLRCWVDLGWRIGSYADRYNEPEPDDDEDDVDADDGQEESGNAFPVDREYERSLDQPMLSPRRRPKELNQVIRAMVRTMVEVHNDEAAAYAMDKTKRYFSDDQLKENDFKYAKAWRDARDEYNDMGWKKQWKWRERVMRTHPRLDKLVEQL